MSTRSSIAVEHADGSVSAIYCHFDGYLDGVGEALVKHHNSLPLAEALVALGDCSQVSAIGDVVAYSRDKGENFEDVAPKKYYDRAAYFSNVGEDIGDNGYRYLFADGRWLVWGRNALPSPLSVAEALVAKKKADDEEGRSDG